jgi:Fur family ferric uptake transcriptional regulator
VEDRQLEGGGQVDVNIGEATCRHDRISREVVQLKNSDLRKVGLKVTAPRIKILKILEERQIDHLKAEDVYKSLLESGDDIGLATVYRVLTQFEAAGLVKRHNFESGGAVFELDDGTHHDHIVCQECGRVEEFLDPVIESRQEDIARDHGFEIISHSMILYGRCGRDGCTNRKRSG